MSFSLSQQKALAIVPKVTGCLSMTSSATILWLIGRQAEPKTVYHRLLVGMSVADISSSLWLSLSTWPIPRESGILWASGTDRTVLGPRIFYAIWYFVAPVQCLASLYYLLVIRYSWKEEKLQTIEKWLHLGPLVWATGTTIASLAMNLFGSANLWCWLAQSGPWTDNPNLWRWAFFYGPLWSALLFVTMALLSVFHHVRTVTLRSEQYLPDVVSTQVFYDHGFRESNSNGRIRAASTRAFVAQPSHANRRMATLQQQQQASSSAQPLPPVRRSSATAPTLHVYGMQVPRAETELEASPSMPVTTTTTSTTTTPSITDALLCNPICCCCGGCSNNNNRPPLHPFAIRRRQVAHQCLRYACAFYLTWIPISLVRILQTMDHPPVYAILLWAAIATPMQGLPNFCIYLFPQYVARRQAQQRNVTAPEEEEEDDDASKEEEECLEDEPTVAANHHPSHETTPRETVQEATTTAETNGMDDKRETGVTTTIHDALESGPS